MSAIVPPLARVNLHREVLLDDATVRDSADLLLTVESLDMAVANKRWLREILTYVCFTLLYALFPIGCLCLVRSVQGSSFNIPVLVADGGILSIAMFLNAGAFSHLIAEKTKWPEVKIVLAASALDSTLFVDVCFLVFIASIVIGFFCRLVPEDER